MCRRRVVQSSTMMLSRVVHPYSLLRYTSPELAMSVQVRGNRNWSRLRVTSALRVKTMVLFLNDVKVKTTELVLYFGVFIYKKERLNIERP